MERVSQGVFHRKYSCVIDTDSMYRALMLMEQFVLLYYYVYFCGFTASLPFFVSRSRTGNLPVYTDYKHGRKTVLTQIRKIDGDIMVSGIVYLPVYL